MLYNILIVALVTTIIVDVESQALVLEKIVENSTQSQKSPVSCPVCPANALVEAPQPLKRPNGFECNGEFRPTSPKIQRIITECREEFKNATQENFFCTFVCIARKYGVLKYREFMNVNMKIKMIEEVYPPKYRSKITNDVLKCISETDADHLVPEKDDLECGKWLPYIRCVRQALYKVCLVHAEGVLQSQQDNVVDLFVTYAGCKNTIRTHGPWILKNFKECLDQYENGTTTDVFYCQYYKTGIVYKNGSVNLEKLGGTWGESYPKEIRAEFNEMLEGTKRCVEEFPIGPFNHVNGNRDWTPYFACTQRNFFRVCRPDEVLVPFDRA